MTNERLLSSFAILCFAVACEGSPPPLVPCPPASPASAAAARPRAAARPAAPEPKPEGELGCLLTGPALAAPPSDAGAPAFCMPLHQREVARVEKRLRKDFEVPDKPAKLVIGFDCDVLAGRIEEVVLEGGSAHGGSLRIARLLRDDGKFTLRIIESSLGGKHELAVKSGDLSERRVDDVVARARVAMLARPIVVPLQDDRGSYDPGPRSFSTWEIHRDLRLLDDDGSVLSRAFTGYNSTAVQRDLLPMRIATDELDDLVDGGQVGPVEASDEDRAFFTRRLVRLFEGQPEWWIAEHYLFMAARLGTKEAVPVVARASVAPLGSSPSDTRRRAAALSAVAALTGSDPRARGGAVLSDDEAAARILASCPPPVAPVR